MPILLLYEGFIVNEFPFKEVNAEGKLRIFIFTSHPFGSIIEGNVIVYDEEPTKRVNEGTIDVSK